MKRERIIEILAEACEIEKSSLSADLRKLIMADEALTAMTRAVEEANQPLEERIVKLQDELFEKENNPNYQSDLTRLRQCEAIVREMAKDNDFIEVVLLRRKSKEWVKENPVETSKTK